MKDRINQMFEWYRAQTVPQPGVPQDARKGTAVAPDHFSGARTYNTDNIVIARITVRGTTAIELSRFMNHFMVSHHVAALSILGANVHGYSLRRSQYGVEIVLHQYDGGYGVDLERMDAVCADYLAGVIEADADGYGFTGAVVSPEELERLRQYYAERQAAQLRDWVSKGTTGTTLPKTNITSTWRGSQDNG